MDAEITAIINIYKRPHTVKDQITAILNQTIKPKYIYIWNNGNQTIDLSEYKHNPIIRVFDNNANYGVWSRFLIGFLASTEYICIFDDDTIPNNRWFENCYTEMQKREALYGTIGVIFKDDNEYIHLKRYGWDGHCDKSMPVDIVGHSWFFKRNWLSYFTREFPKVHTQISNGEDMHFSLMLQKYANIPTLVPPHPSNDLSLFGSKPASAWAIGCDGNSETGSNYPLNKMYCENLANGFRLLKHRTTVTSIDDFNMFKDMILKRKPFAIIRPADREYAILQNRTLTNIDNWTFQANGKLHSDLNNALHLASNKQCFIGIPCECCNSNMAYWYIKTFNLHPNYTTFANIFCNKNWSSWIDLLKNEKIQFTYIGPRSTDQFNIENHIHIPEYLVNDWNSKSEEYMTIILDTIRNTENKIYIFSCGPLAKIFIAHAWNINPRNIYIDAGSTLDKFTKGHTNRDYTNLNSDLSKLICRFSPNLIRL